MIRVKKCGSSCSKLLSNCRFDRQWCERYDTMRVVGILPLRHNNYEGHFLAVEGGRLPDPGCDKWVVGGGMYPADLRAEFHVFRELWQGRILDT